MWWLTAQIFFCLLLAAAVGLIIGWMLRRLLGDDAPQQIGDEAFYGQSLTNSLDPPGLLASESSPAEQSALNAEITTLRSTIDDLSAQNQLLAKQQSDAELQRASFVGQSGEQIDAQTSAQIQALEARDTQYRERVNQLETQVSSILGENEHLQQQLNRNQQTASGDAASQRETEELRGRISALTADKDSKAKELNRLKKQWETDQVQHRQAKQQIEEQVDQITALAQEREQALNESDQLRQQINGDHNNTTQLKSNNDDLQRQFSQTSQERDALKKRVADLEEQSRALRVLAEDAQDTRELRQTITESRREIDQFKKDNAKLGDNLQAALGELDGLRKEHESAQAQVHTLTDRAALADKLPQTEKNLEQSQQQLAKLEADRQQLQSRLSKAETERNEALTQRDETQQKNKTLNETQTSLDEQTRTLKKDVTRFSNQASQLETEVARLRGEADDAKKAAKDAKLQQAEALKKASQIETENARLQKTHDEVQQQSQSSAATETTLRNNLIEITKQRNAVAQQNDRLQGEVFALKANERGDANVHLGKDASDEVAELTEKLDTANTELTRLRAAAATGISSNTRAVGVGKSAEVALQQRLTEATRQQEALKQRNQQLENDITGLNRKLVEQATAPETEKPEPGKGQVALFRQSERNRSAPDQQMSELIELRNRLQSDNEKLQRELTQLTEQSRSTINQERELRASLTHTKHQRDDLEKQLRQIRDQLGDGRSASNTNATARSANTQTPSPTPSRTPPPPDADVSITEQGTSQQPAQQTAPTSQSDKPAGKTITISDADRPGSIAEPRRGSPDDLKRIKGIGPVIERKLQALGVFHFDQIAQWTPETGEWINQHLDFPGRVAREKWVRQATRLTRSD